MNLINSASTDRAMQAGATPDEWMRTAFERLLRTNPDFDGYESNIEMIESDEPSSYGYGQILARRGDVVIRIPFFVEEGQLKPMDLFFLGDDIHPMSKDRLDKLFFSQGEVGEVASEQDIRGSRLGEQGPGGYQRISGQPQVRSYPSYDKQAADLLGRVLKTASPTAVQASMGRARPSQVEALLRAERDDLFDKMAAVGEAPASPAAPVRAVRVKQAAPGSYRIEEVAEALPGDPVPNVVNTVTMAAAAAEQHMKSMGEDDKDIDWKAKTALDEADQGKEVVVPIAVPLKTLQVVRTHAKEAADSDEGGIEKIAEGAATLWRADGKARSGMVCHLHDYDGSTTGGSLFIGEGEHVAGDALIGQRKEATGGPAALLASHGSGRRHARRAKTAAWVWQDEEGSYHATKPFTVRSQMKDGDRFKVAALNEVGRRFHYEASAVARITPSTPKTAGEHTAAFYVPSSYTLVDVGDAMETLKEATLREGLAQQAFTQEGDPLTVVRADPRHYRITGPGTDKLASHAVDLTAEGLSMVLATYGAAPSEQEKVAAALKEEDRVTVLGLDWLPRDDSQGDTVKVAKTYPRAGNVIAAIAEVREEVQDALWKIASDYAEPELGTYMTDTAVALDMAEENQIDDFMQHLPLLEEAVRTCAALLMQVRMGRIDMVDEEVRDAMMALDKVVQALHGLDAG